MISAKSRKPYQGPANDYERDYQHRASESLIYFFGRKLPAASTISNLIQSCPDSRAVALDIGVHTTHRSRKPSCPYLISGESK
jgi:hypothetical protein